MWRPSPANASIGSSALVVQLRKEADEKADDQGVLGRIFSALSGPSTRGRAAEHE